ncbi:MAG: hypothetical protein PF569_04420 [Candidatus Woesearchaeota archaeon]|jgi:hypothetical protein|nr:hypothetical protein [Candidatus Woesearchaeota archaeon]
MILTKDNLLRYVRDKKAVTPTMVSEAFDTTTMIASAALSEIAKDKSIAITNLKLSSSPYYYDPKQKECLIELAEKHFSKHDKDIYLKLKQNQVLNHSSLNIQETLAIERIKDFAIPLEISETENELKFWVWYLRDISETKSQIMDAIKGNNSTPKKTNKEPEMPKVQERLVREIRKEIAPQQIQRQTHQPRIQSQANHQQTLNSPKFTQQSVQEEQQNKEEMFIENYFRQNYLNIENKNKSNKEIRYNLSLNINQIKILIDSIYYYKKPNETDIMQFYTSSLKPKIIFVQNAPKKLLKMNETLENLTIINI